MNATVDEVQAVAGLYGEILRTLIDRLRTKGVISNPDLSALAEAVIDFQATEGLPPAVSAHCDLVVEWLAVLQADRKNDADG